MMELLGSFQNYFLIITTLIILTLSYVINTFGYWKRKNVPYKALVNIFDRKYLVRNIYNYAKTKNSQIYGVFFFTKPALVIRDLNLIKHVLVKDFQHFDSRGTYYNEEDDPLSAHLFSIDGSKWKRLRAKLSPTFTSGKMKLMFHLISDQSNRLINYIDENKNGFDCKEALSSFTINVIGSCAFGLECNGFSNIESPFKTYSKKLFNTTFMQTIKLTLVRTFPSVAKSLHLRLISEDVSTFYMKVVKDSVKYREKNNINKSDFLQILINLKNQKDDNTDEDLKNFTIEEIAAQCFVFFLAGFETSSSLVTFSLYEMVQNIEIQEKARQEILTVLKKYDGKITYESVMEMPYLQCVLEESMRKYPALPILIRKCTKDYILPNTDVVIESGTPILIPAREMHYDPDYYPDPNEFKPERFNEENKSKIPQYAYLPFGEGPRICIGKIYYK